MSALDQPLLIANSNYHVGQQIAIRVAEEQGYFRAEGFTNYKYEGRGLIPGPVEPEGLALAVKEHGLDIITAVNVESIIFQRSKGADLYIVSGWRYESNPDLKWHAAKGIKDLRGLRGRKIGTREPGDLTQISMFKALRMAGVDPEKEVHWVYDPIFAYRTNPAHAEMLRSGKVDAVASGPPFSEQLEKEGYGPVLDPKTKFPRGKLGKVIIATERTIERRRDELSAFLRAIIRAFWFMRDRDHFEYLRDLELRLRRESRNDEERVVSLLSSPAKVEGWTLPIDLRVPQADLEEAISDMVQRGRLEQPLSVNDVVRDDLAVRAYKEVSGRAELEPALSKALAAVQKYGF